MAHDDLDRVERFGSAANEGIPGLRHGAPLKLRHGFPANAGLATALQPTAMRWVGIAGWTLLAVACADVEPSGQGTSSGGDTGTGSTSGVESSGGAGDSSTSEAVDDTGADVGSTSSATSGSTSGSGSSSESGAMFEPGEVTWTATLGGAPFDVEFREDGDLQLIWFDAGESAVISRYDAEDGSALSQTEYPPPADVTALFTSALSVGPAGAVAVGVGWQVGGATPGIVALLHGEADDGSVWSLQTPDIGFGAFAVTESGVVIGHVFSAGLSQIAAGELVATIPTSGTFLAVAATPSAGEVWFAGLDSGVGVARRFDTKGVLTQEIEVGESAGVNAVSVADDGRLFLAGGSGPTDQRIGFVRIYAPDGSPDSMVELGDGVTSFTVHDLAINGDAVAVSTTEGVMKLDLDLDPVWSQPFQECRGVDIDADGGVVAVCNDGAGSLIAFAP